MGPERPGPGAKVVSVRFEHREGTLGVGTPEPRLSWQVRTDDPAWRQTAYQVRSECGPTALADSPEVQVQVPHPLTALAPG